MCGLRRRGKGDEVSWDVMVQMRQELSSPNIHPPTPHPPPPPPQCVCVSFSSQDQIKSLCNLHSHSIKSSLLQPREEQLQRLHAVCFPQLLLGWLLARLLSTISTSQHQPLVTHSCWENAARAAKVWAKNPIQIFTYEAVSPFNRHLIAPA